MTLSRTLTGLAVPTLMLLGACAQSPDIGPLGYADGVRPIVATTPVVTIAAPSPSGRNAAEIGSAALVASLRARAEASARDPARDAVEVSKPGTVSIADDHGNHVLITNENAPPREGAPPARLGPTPPGATGRVRVGSVGVPARR